LQIKITNKDVESGLIEGKIAEEWFDLALEEEDPVMEQKIKA